MKKIFTLLTLIVLLSVVTVQAQSTKWKKGNFTAVNFNQASFTNWTAGGQNSVGLTALLNSFARYQNADSSTVWDNTGDFTYGFIKNGEEGLRKNEDKIELQTKYGKKAFNKIYYTGLVNFRSQFANGFNFPNDSTIVSQFLAPGYLTASLGLEWRPKDWFSFYLSPTTGKFTFVLNDALSEAGAYGVEGLIVNKVYDSTGFLISSTVVQENKKIRSEFGAYASIKFQKDIVKNINFRSKLDLFNNYTDKKVDNRKNIDVNWDNALVMKVNKYIAVTILATLIYDNDIPFIDGEGNNFGPQIQFKQNLGVGFSYKF